MKKAAKILVGIFIVLLSLHLSLIFGASYFLNEEDFCEARLKLTMGQSIFEPQFYKDQPMVREVCKEMHKNLNLEKRSPQ